MGKLLQNRILWPALGLLVLLLFNLVYDPGFFQLGLRDGRLYGDMVSVLLQAAKIIPVAVGMTLVIATGGVDLSVGSVMALAGTLAAMLLAATGAPLIIAVLAAILLAMAIGAINGALIAYAKIQPIIASLIFMVLARGVAMWLTDGMGQPIEHPALLFMGSGYVFGVPFAVVLVLVFAGVVSLFLKKTAAGLYIAAVGDNASASRLCGINQARIKVGIYAFCGLCAGLAGLIAAARVESAEPARMGELVELDAIFAVVVGGTALTGGRFSIAGSIIGAVLIQTLVWTMQKLGVPSDITPVPKALVILLVCLLQSARFRAQVMALFGRRKGVAGVH
jgi:ribose/xylose/arabinose/galactoside ABC-type transport system permease subunit